uniref:Uncharacterized protein n=1 Tax=Arundo donax TaxID=35708 RepID=A0A0A9C001_ARUDO
MPTLFLFVVIPCTTV